MPACKQVFSSHLDEIVCPIKSCRYVLSLEPGNVRASAYKEVGDNCTGLRSLDISILLVL